MKRITIKDIAETTGYSIATISLALSDKPSSISESTKKEIQKIAKELNYFPNQLAVGLKTRKSCMIGIILPDMLNIHISNLFGIIDRELQKNGYFLLTCTPDINQPLEFQRLNNLIGCGIGGLIFLNPSTYRQDEDYQKQINQILKKHQLPAVGCNNDILFNENLGSSVNIDYELGGYLATRHLIDLGHTKIGCITGPFDMAVTDMRLHGYKRALEEANIDYDPKLLYEGNYEIESGQAALPYLLGQNVSAIFSFNDNMAFGLFKSARTFKLHIPEDLSIVGFDDVYLDEILETPLTSINVHANQIGKTVAQEIMRLIENPKHEFQSIHFDTYLMVRGSTRAKPNLSLL